VTKPYSLKASKAPELSVFWIKPHLMKRIRDRVRAVLRAPRSWILRVTRHCWASVCRCHGCWWASPGWSGC